MKIKERIYNLFQKMFGKTTNKNLKGPSMKFIIPTDGMSKENAKNSLTELMHSYNEDVNFDETTGTIIVNGKMNIPYKKEYWFGPSDGTSPNIEPVDESDNSESINYFRNQLKKVSNIPSKR